jgi:triacylglycerol lipase
MSTARLLRLGLAVELLIYAIALGYFGERLGLSEGRMALALVAALLGSRALLIATTFFFAWIKRSPRAPQERIGLAAALGMVLAEYLSFVALFVLIQPFERWFMGGERLRRLEPGEVPLLLVHGYTCNRGSWWRLRRRLERAGHCVGTVDLDAMFGAIDAGVEPLAKRIEALCRETGAGKVALVGHSMGGLVCRAYLERHGPQRVARLVTLGTPHQGSWLARLGWGRNAREMRPGCDWMAKLNRCELPAQVTATSIYSVHDNFVVPQAAQRLPGAQHVALTGVGHLALVFASKRAARALLDALGEPARARAA